MNTVWIDRGGTFTDCIMPHPGDPERLLSLKVLSSDLAPVVGIRRLFGLEPSATPPPCDVRLGTTIATNALLERGGTPAACVLDAGMGDLLSIDDQRRPALFDPSVARPEPLTADVVELRARLGANGAPIVAFDEEIEVELRVALRRLRARGVEALAVCLLHALVDPVHELRVGRIATELGFRHVSLSHAVSPEPGLLARAQTTLADAYLTPVLRHYLRRLAAALPGSRLRVMRSDGTLAAAEEVRGRDVLLSGPAGGLVATAAIAREADDAAALAFDMGGTSTDVCRVHGGLPEVRYETMVGGVRVRAPSVDVHTVAAGGGSVCRFADRHWKVGPQSVGADPGPLCYGKADPSVGDVALTDAAAVLGRVRPERFPFPLDLAAARTGLARLAREAGLQGPDAPERAALGLVRVAVEAMASAVEEVSIARGHDPRDHLLVAYGGASGQYACELAERLGVSRVLLHPMAGVLSAWGIGLAPEGWAGARYAAGPLEESYAEILASAVLLREEGEAALPGGTLEERVDLRYRGADASLAVPLAGLEELSGPDAIAVLRTRFHSAHRRRFGYAQREREIESVVVRSRRRRPTSVVRSSAQLESSAEERATLQLSDGPCDAPLVRREALSLDEEVPGPLLVLESTGTIYVARGWRLRRRSDDVVELRREGVESHEHRPVAGRDAAGTAIVGQRFASIAERMGGTLQRTAASTNIRDRHDYSCAVFDAAGLLVANAPHIPVHLGAMGATVRAVLADHPDIGPGEVFASNDPAAGGSHLPDITLVQAYFDDAGRRRGFVAARGHHADVGGVTPGSMPASSASIAEEGVVLRGLRVAANGEIDADRVLAALTGGSMPARRPRENLADLAAQVAACATGVRELARFAEEIGGAALGDAMDDVLALGAEVIRSAVAALPDGVRSFADTLDDGTPIAARATIEGDRLRIDFGASATQAHPGNLNAPRAVTDACVLYVLRVLAGRDVPLNEGCLRAVEVVVPPGSLLDPPAGVAVAGGNVETSQRIVDTLMAALGLSAGGPGTMNNVSLGDASFGYYETIAGGGGAGPTYPGVHCAHQHMTNSRITDPEVLERRHPLRLWRFARRPGSGGAGRHPGGDGVVREWEALAPLEVSVLAERRVRGPRGSEGGSDGLPGIDEVVRADGSSRRLVPGEGLSLASGDRLRISTPGGGGWGVPLELDGDDPERALGRTPERG